MKVMLQGILFCLIVIPFISCAGVVVTGTRVIYPASSKEVTVPLKNKGQHAVLVQSWLDTGDPLALPEKIQVPFVLTPPITRIDSGAGQTLRLSYIGGRLPDDRESIFWLNVLAIPPKKAKNENRYIDVAYQTRIKLFYRPKNLALRPDDAPHKLQWLKREHAWHVKNPTPYFISLIDVRWTSGADTYSLAGEMIAPFSDLTLAEEKNNSVYAATALNYSMINDNGAVVTFNASFK